MQSGQDISEITQQHEAEMQEIRKQILSLSEKYSAKCLESSDLEAKIESLAKHLSSANKCVSDLEARNAKLQAQLNDQIDGIKVRKANGLIA